MVSMHYMPPLGKVYCQAADKECFDWDFVIEMGCKYLCSEEEFHVLKQVVCLFFAKWLLNYII